MKPSMAIPASIARCLTSRAPSGPHAFPTVDEEGARRRRAPAPGLGPWSEAPQGSSLTQRISPPDPTGENRKPFTRSVTPRISTVL